MAAADSMNQLIGLGNLIGQVTGKSSSQKSTQTTQGNISQTGVDRLLEQILSGKGGVKDISGAVRGAGLYNSSTELQLQNDLAARAAGEVEARRAGTTTTTETETDQPGIGIGSLIAPLAGAAVVRPLLDKFMGMAGDALNPAASAAGTSSALVAPTAGSGFTQAGPAVGDLSNMAALGAAGTASGINNVISGLTSAGSGTAIQGAGALSGNLASDLGMAFGDAASAGSTALSAGAGGGAAGGLSSVPIVGNILSGLLGGQNGDPFGNPFGFASTLASGAMSMGPLGLIAAPVAATFGMMLSDLGISVVCTALQKYGHLDKAEYAKGQEFLKKLNRRVVRGYYHWGVPLAYRIYAEEGKGKWTRLALPWARSRTKLIASSSKTRYLRYPLGTLTVVIGQPICWCIGGLLDLRDYLVEKRDGIRI